MIKFDSVTPLYEQLSLEMQKKIYTGELKPGERLASISKFVSKYSVSRVTIVNAINDLVKKGFVISRQGKGTFVKDSYIGEELLSLRSFKEIQADGQTKVIRYETIPMPNELADIFTTADTEIVQIYRLHICNDEPIGLTIMNLPKSIAQASNMSQDILGRFGMFEYLEKSDIVIISATQTIHAIVATPEISKILDIPEGSPILHAERTSFDATRRAIMHSTFHYKGDSYSYTITLQRMSGNLF